MKICFLASSESIHSYRWVRYFAQRGHGISWISLHPSIFPPISNVQYYEFRPTPNNPLGSPSVLLKIRNLLKTIRPDILHAHYVGTYGLLGALSGFRPFVTSAWGSDILFAGRTWYKRPLVKFALRRSLLVTTDAYHMIGAMKAMGIPEKKLRLIGFGIDTTQFRRSVAYRQEMRQKLSLNHSPTVISLRTLDPIYDVGTLVRAVPHVLKEVPEAKFLIAGTGSQELAIRHLAQELGVTEAVRFLGRIPNEQLPQYLSASDAYVSTSLSDAGIASSTAEAMSCELPVVVTDSGENSRWVRNGESGFLVPVQNPDVLAERVVELLTNRETRIRLGQLGRATIQERDDYSNEMSKMEKLYQEVSNERAS